MFIRSFVVKAEDGGYLRFSLGVPSAGPPGARDVFVESAPTADGDWAPRAAIPALSKGYVGHYLGLLGICEVLFGRVGGYTRGKEEDVNELKALLAKLS